MLNVFMRRLYEDLMSICAGLVVKRDDLAREAETIESLRNFERYMAALKGDTNFYVNRVYDDDILRVVLPAPVYSLIGKNMNNIPMKYREAISKLQASANIKNYVEMNDYYRQYIGLPDMTDRNFIYIRDIDSIDPHTPIHALTNAQIRLLETTGRLDIIRKKHPNKNYLNFLGYKKLDLVTIRIARPYDILDTGDAKQRGSLEAFKKEYYYAKTYMLKVMYHPDTYGDLELYHASIGMLILCLAIRNTLSPDNYAYMNAEEILNAMLQSYNLYETFKYLPIVYKKRLVLKIDDIIASKGTDKVLSEICNIFSYDSIIINRYYLVKHHKKTTDGFEFPRTPNGEIDYDSQYTLGFARADVDSDRLIFDSVLESLNATTAKDPLWQANDDDLLKIKKSELSTMMSEYLSIDTIFEMNALLFELSYFVNLLLDIRESTEDVYIPNMYSETSKSNCFTMMVFILAMFAKKLGYDGNIVYEPLHIAEVYKFNLSDLSEQISSIIKEFDLDLTVSSVLLTKPKVNMSADDIIRLYNENRRMYEKIVEKMETTSDYKEYCGLLALQKIMYVSALTKENFMKVDGTPATTYLDMLRDLDSQLYNLLVDAGDESLDNILVYSLEKMEEIFNDESLRFLFTNIPTVGSDLIGKYLRLVLDIFKESSSEIIAINKIFDVSSSTVTLDRKVRLFCKAEMATSIRMEDSIITTDRVGTHTQITLIDRIYVDDQILI